MSGKLVLTVGSVLRGDDAAGPMLAKIMEDNPLDGWEVIDGGQTPEDEISVVRRKNPEFLLLVDAADMGLAPGEVRILEEEDVYTDYMITTHSLPLSYLLHELTENCGSICFLGIQPAHTEFFGALHPQVRSAIDDIYQHIATGDVAKHYMRLER